MVDSLRFLRLQTTKDTFSGSVGFALAKLEANTIQDVEAEDKPNSLARFSQYFLKEASLLCLPSMDF